MTKVRTLSVIAVTAMILTGSLWVFAQDDSGPAGKELSDLWDDFIHYVKISRPELAQSYAQSLLDHSSEAMAIYKLYIDTDNVETHLARAERMSDEMKPLVDRLRLVIDGGYLELRADPEEIANSIELLAGGARAYARGSDRLVASGEYAMPQLIQKLMDPGTDPQLYERIVAVLPKIGRDAVRPLSVALQSGDEKLQKILAEVLTVIEYPHAVPRLRELYDDPETLPRVKGVLERTIVACGGSDALTKPLASLYYDAALDYYNRQESVQADIRYDEGIVWFWEPTLGVIYKKVPRTIFCDVYAMRLARLALHHDSHFEPAVSLWLAAAMRREIDLPAGSADPLWPAEMPPAAYYARAAGAGFAQQVLARALKDFNASLAIAAIEALAVTAGSESLVDPLPGGAQPLVEALTYPNRRVRYLAAVSLARALPSETFVGSPVVLNILNEALRQRGGTTALLVASDPTQNNILKDALRGAGFNRRSLTCLGCSAPRPPMPPRPWSSALPSATHSVTGPRPTDVW
jgi:HEAT repeat protein